MREEAARRVYARMRQQGEPFEAAAKAVALRPGELDQARGRLAELGLLHPGAGIAVDAMAALTRMISDGDDLIHRLAVQRAASRALTEHYLDLPYGTREDGPVEFFPRSRVDELRRRLRTAEVAATGEIVAMHTPHTWDPVRLAYAFENDRESVERGVRVRVMHSHGQLHMPVLREHIQALMEHGVEVRTAHFVPVRMIIMDRRTATVEVAPGDLEAGALFIEDHALTATLAALFDYCWMTASEPKDVPRGADGEELTDQQRAVLRLLATGAKDDAIARALGVSTRTVTRVVGELSAVLGVTSRFQAGVRAAKLGWL
ncbi:MAG: hypothetical protein HOV86_00025 [Thermoactinospora sp.]|nr:hypothetical protein [Thermoactinospora sp.]